MTGFPNRNLSHYRSSVASGTQLRECLTPSAASTGHGSSQSSAGSRVFSSRQRVKQSGLFLVRSTSAPARTFDDLEAFEAQARFFALQYEAQPSWRESLVFWSLKLFPWCRG